MMENNKGNNMEKPILFNAEMVRAILEGRKTQTRRPVKVSQKILDDWGVKSASEMYSPIQPSESSSGCDAAFLFSGDQGYEMLKSPFPQVGGNLWVRETFSYPREASRINLKVKRVWVERIQDISEEDATKEGVEEYKDPCPESIFNEIFKALKVKKAKYKPAFSFLWDSIYTGQKLGWDSNPWVWCCEFEVE